VTRQWIRISTLAVLMLLSAATVAGQAPSNALWTSLLKHHVVIVEGGHASRVDYAGMRRDQILLDKYTRQLSAVAPAQFRTWGKSEQMAFLINAYNAFTVQLILRRWPKLDSIKDLGGLFSSPWRQRFFILLGHRMDLDGIEAMLREPGRYNEPRIHFAPTAPRLVARCFNLKRTRGKAVGAG